MAATKATISAILKEMYEGRLNDVRNTFNTAWERAPKSIIGPGENHNYAARHGRSTSAGFQSETGVLRTPDVQKQTQGRYVMRECYSTIRLSWRVMRLARSEPAVFADKLQDEFEGMWIDTMDLHEVVLCNDGSGTLATVSSIDDGTTAGDGFFVVTNKEDLRKFHVGMILEAWSTPLGGATQRAWITGVTTATVSDVTWDGTDGKVFLAEDISGAGTTVTAGDSITRAGTRTSTTTYEPHGIYAICSATDPMPDTDLGGTGLNNIPASNPWWQAYVNSNSAVNRPLTTKLMEDLCDALMIRSGRHPDEFWQPYGVRAAFGNEQQAQRRTVNNYIIRGSTQPGFQDDSKEDYITFKGKPFIPLKYAQPNTLLALCNDCWSVKREGEMEWVDDDGSKLSRTTDRQPAFEAVLASLWNTKTTQRNAFGRLNDLIGDDSVAF